MARKKQLTKKQKQYVVQAIAELLPSTEIQAHLSQYFKREVPISTVDNYRQSHQQEIDQVRAKFIENLAQIPISLKYYRLQVLDFLINDLKPNGEVEKGNHAIIGQLLGLARQEMTEVVADVRDNVHINKQIKQYFILTGEDISQEQVQELTTADWQELHAPQQKKALPSGTDDKADEQPKDGLPNEDEWS